MPLTVTYIDAANREVSDTYPDAAHIAESDHEDFLIVQAEDDNDGSDGEMEEGLALYRTDRVVKVVFE